MGRPAGFSIFELVVVMLLMSVLAAAVASRSITTADLDLNSATDQLRNRLRLAQADAMKRSPAVWGISYAGAEYWLFSSTPSNRVNFPGASSDHISLPSGITVSGLADVYFDRIGKPFTAYTDPSNNTQLASTMTITVSAGGDTRTITVTPETGLIR